MTLQVAAGTMIDGRYRVISRVGSGGMAEVYCAEDGQLGRRVAVKLLHERFAQDEEFVERFRREASSAASLSHANIVSVYDRGEWGGTYYIAMEYLDGRSLDSIVREEAPLTPERAIEITEQVLRAARFAHRRGVVHRDLKPHNVIIDDEGRVKVTDFGIARAGASEITQTGSIMGTARYLSPEQAQGQAVSPRSDLYAIGIMLYELLTGTVPFSGDTPVEIAMKHLSQVPEPPSTMRPDIPHDLDLIVMRALAKNPDERYQSAEEMDADLERVAGGGPVTPETVEFATQIMRAPAEPFAPTAATMITPARYASQIPPLPPPIYYDLEQPIHRRPIWPWIAALLFAVGAGVGGWYIYHQISNKLSNSAPVAVRLYLDMQEQAARDAIKADGFSPVVNHHASGTTQKGLVYKQVPTEGNRVAKGSPITIWVSSGKPKVAVPPLKGMSSAAAEAALTKLKLTPDVHPVPGGAKAGIVVAQDPKEGTKLIEGAKVRINVAKGPTPVPVPSVVNDSISVATAALNQLGFKVIPTFVDSTLPANTVLGQSPNAGTTAAKNSSVSLTVSKGPQSVAVPEVTGLDYGSATQQLQTDGLRSTIVYETVTDPNSDGVVLDQSPAGGSLVKPNARVVLTVGRYKSSGTTTATTTDTTTTTTDTTTTPTPTPTP